MSSGAAVVSTQVLQEYFVIATRKLGVEAAVARRKVELIGTADVVEVRMNLILGAVDLHRLHQLSFWDALILKCAAAAGCTRLLTEDLQHGQVIEGVRVEDPFRWILPSWLLLSLRLARISPEPSLHSEGPSR